jgi:putative transposase
LICRILGQHRSTQRRQPRGRADEERLVADMIELTRQYGHRGDVIQRLDYCR